jgi:ethanolamine utilization protein EutA (predicted chaperonin)
MKFMKSLFAMLLTVLVFAANAQLNEVNPSDLLKLLPDKIDGFKRAEDFKSEKMKIGTIIYSLCEKKFRKKKSTIELLLFDYGYADIMYKQAVSKWSEMKPVESESVVMNPIKMDNCVGWESNQKHTGQSQIALGIGGRYLLEITGDQVDLSTLQAILKEIPIEKFPK